MEVEEQQQQQQQPDDFKCPISLEIMLDPVILPTGHTFDRSSIQRWLDGGHLTCPVTNLPLPPSPPLIPNHSLRRLISSSSSSSSAKTPNSSFQELEYHLTSISYPASQEALRYILKLSKNPATRRAVLESGAVAVVLRHAAGGQEVAVRCVLHLSLDGDDARVGLVADGAVDALVSTVVLNGAAAAIAATAVTSLATVDVNKCTIGAHPSAMDGLCRLLCVGGEREKKEAATAVFELCKLPDNRRRVVRAGGVPAIVEFAANGSARAVEVLGLLVKCQEGREVMRRTESFVGVMVEVMRSGNYRGIEQALLVLNWVCSEDECMAAMAISEGALGVCGNLVADDNCKISKNAAELLRTLEKMQFGGGF